MRPAALTIAGFDPSGGAGVQADLRVFNAVGVAGWSVATAITIQNTQGVHGVHQPPAIICTISRSSSAPTMTSS